MTGMVHFIIEGARPSIMALSTAARKGVVPHGVDAMVLLVLDP